MKKLLAFILWLPACAFAQVPPPSPASVQDVIDGTATYKFISPAVAAAAGLTGGGGTYVSNQLELSFTVDVWRTNNTPQIWVVDSTITASPGGGNGFCQWQVDTNLNGTADWDFKRSGVNGGTDVVHGTLGGIVLPGWAFRYFNNSVGGSAGPEVGTGSIYYYSTNSSGGGGSGDVTAAGLAAGDYPIEADALTGTASINTTGNAALATNLPSTTHYSTNTVEDHTRIYVTGTLTPSSARGVYYLLWTNQFQGVWTNPTTPYIIWLADPSEVGITFRITDNTNSANFIYSARQFSENPAGGTANFWFNPLDTVEGAVFGGEATLTYGTNYIVTNNITYLTASGRAILPQHVPTNSLIVSLTGDDTLANRTNGWPFKTLHAANLAAQWGDYIYVEPGWHRTYGFYMKHGITIGGAGRNTVIEPQMDLNLSDNAHTNTFFQSQLISIRDAGTLENLTITNGAVGFTQLDGAVYGGTNQLARDLWIYPPYLTASNALFELIQPGYFGAGVRFTRIGNNTTCERIRIYSSANGFAFQSVVGIGATNSQVNLIDCEVYCEPQFLGTNNYWRYFDSTAGLITNIGGMIPIAMVSRAQHPDQEPHNRTKFTLNIRGGRFTSMNGATNDLVFVGGETNASRNAGIWISRGYTNFVTVNFENNPQFILGNTNTTVAFVLNETTNNRVTINGLAQTKFVANGDTRDAGTNSALMNGGQFVGDGNGLTNTLDYQAAYGTGTPAVSSSSQTLIDFGTTDPAFTVTKTGIYEIKSTVVGSTSSADSGHACSFLVTSNAVEIANSAISINSVDPGLASMVMPYNVALPPIYTKLLAGDTIQLRWQSLGNSYSADYACLSILRIK